VLPLNVTMHDHGGRQCVVQVVPWSWTGLWTWTWTHDARNPGRRNTRHTRSSDVTPPPPHRTHCMDLTGTDCAHRLTTSTSTHVLCGSAAPGPG